MKLYNVYRADANLQPIDRIEITPEEGVHGEIYVCKCGRQAHFRVSQNGTPHFFAKHDPTCEYADKPQKPLTNKTDEKTDINRLVNKIKKEELKKPPKINKIDFTIDTDESNTLPPLLKRQNRNIRTASEISLYLDEQGIDHRIGAALNNTQLHIPSKDFYADSRGIGGIRINGYRYGVGLALVRPTHPDRFGIELPQGISCMLLRDIYSFEEDTSSVMLYLVTFANSVVKDDCWRTIKSRKDGQVIALMGDMTKLDGYGDWNIHRVHVTHPDNVKLRTAPSDVLSRWQNN